MESSILKKAGRFLREQGKNKRWRKILTVLGAAVVFVTAYILLMPAVALERKSVCDLPEHTHTEECYGQVAVCGKVGVGDETSTPPTLEFHCTFPETLHVHTDECYNQDGEPVCGYADFAVHQHDSSCYDQDGTLVCPLPEIEEHEHTNACYRINDSGYICGMEESEAHKHTDDCYTEHRELICEKEEVEGHIHTDDCYTEKEKIVCGLEDDEEHEHDETCYETVKELTCEEEESKGHEHDKSCYTVERELTCEKEENPVGHTHTEACRGVVKELVCGKEEIILHQHSIEDGCYEPVLDDEEEQMRDENGELLWNLICEQPEITEHIHNEECYVEHEHTEECYQEGLICGLEEHTHTDECYLEAPLYCGKIAHVHSPECYETNEAGESVLTCGLEEHIHEEACYELVFYCVNRIHAHSEECYQGGRQLACGYADFVIHTHDEACYGADGALICPLPEIQEHTHTEEECYNEEGSLVCQLPEAKLHTHTEVCYDIDGNLTCGKLELKEHQHSDACHKQEVVEDQEQLYNKIYQGDGYIVTVAYRADAEIPEEAVLLAEQITEEADQEHYAERQAQFQETLGDEGATMRALLKVGFYLDGVEIEPKSDVTVTVQFLDENGLAEGSPITVVHFAEEGTEVLDGSQVKDSSTTFQIGGFSEIAIGYRTGDEVSLYVSEDFEYEDDAFHMTFHVEGKAVPLENGEAIPSEGEPKAPTEAETNEGAQENENEGDEAVEPEGETFQETKQVEESEQEEPEENLENRDIITSEGVTTEEENPFVFQVKTLGKDTEEYAAFLSHATEANGTEELLRMQVFSYSLTYKGVELDLSECKVTVQITTAPALKRQLAQSIPDAVSYLKNYEAAAPNADIIEPVAQSEPNSQGQEEETEPIEETSEEEIEETEDATEDETTEEEEPTNESIGNETEIIISVAGMVSNTPETSDEIALDDVQINNLGSIFYEEEETAGEEAIEGEVNGAFATQVSITANPHFVVQYYANLTVVAESGKNALPVIDTSGKQLPKNNKGETTSPNNNAIKNIYVDDSGVVQTTKKLTEVYKHRTYQYIKAPTINYINALVENPSYNLKEIWLYKESVHTKECFDGNGELICDHEEPNNETANDEEAKRNWDIYKYSKDLHFTNRKLDPSKYQVAQPGGNSGYVMIEEGAVLRLVYDTTTGDPDFGAIFYDYDISDGKIYSQVNNKSEVSGPAETQTQNNASLSYAYTKNAGINSDGNYEGTGTRFAFGNVNTGTTQGENLWTDNSGKVNLLNMFNGLRTGRPKVTGTYKGCTFGLVTGLDENGKIQYANGVIAPKLFDDGEAVGKTTYKDYTLKFDRVGDTHTLTAVNGSEKTKGLESFSHPSPYEGKIHTHIWTNNFWPMDDVGSFGGKGHDLKFGSYTHLGNRAYAGSTKKGEEGSISNIGWDKKTFPYSDDGQDHNSYFGMQYVVPFDLSADYVGPLEYYFFGDDDMWVFLDNELVCDIGGVHSSVGEYVNLWDYITEERKSKLCSHEKETCYNEEGELICEENKFTLRFYYTERGASGSTCWMQFTLPSVSSITPETTDKDYGHLRVEKKVTASSNLSPDEADIEITDEFSFTIKLTNADGTNLPDDYSYVKYSKDGEEIGADLIIHDGGTFTLRNGEYVIIKFLPQGTKYTITESDTALIVDAEGNVTEEESDNYYYTDITSDNDSSNMKADLISDKIAAGDIPSNGQSNILYNNKVRVYELPESGGPGTNLYTMAGISLLLIAGLMYRKKFRERRAGSSRN